MVEHKKAACVGVDPSIFFPLLEADSGPAIDICNGCEVRTECLEYSLLTRQEFGVWGGTLPSERRRILKSKKRREEVLNAIARI